MVRYHACTHFSQCLLGTSLTLADGVFTPAVSVTSAVGGIAVAKASISADITPIAIVSHCLVAALRF
jgi:K+ transporter